MQSPKSKEPRRVGILLLTATRFLRGFIASDAGGSANRTLPVGHTVRLALAPQLHSQQPAWGGTPWACTLGP